MKMDIVAGSKNDEFYTPEYAVKPILKFIPDGSNVWCPFDTRESNFVKLLSQTCCVQNSSLVSGAKQDFFKKDIPIGTQYIISNPPYSVKTEVLARLFEFNVPFAMLVGVVGLFESKKRFNMFKKNSFEIMYLNKRVSYFKNYSDPQPSINPPFSSVYICHNMLPKQIIFEEIEK